MTSFNLPLKKYFSLTIMSAVFILASCGGADSGISGTAITKIIFYDEQAMEPYTVKKYISIDINGSGEQIDEREYAGEGRDGVWFTQDDVLARYKDYEFNDSGKVKKILEYTANIYPSDYGYTLISRTDYKYDGAYIRYIIRYSSGMDGSFDTDDDVITGVIKEMLNVVNKVDKRIVYSSYGDDMEWFTRDDLISSHYAYEYTAAGKINKYIHYTGTGPDGAIFTGDDMVYMYSTYSYNQRNALISVMRYGNSPEFYGPDGIFMTHDDLVNHSYQYATDFDDNGSPARSVYATHAGSDGVWKTEDDIIGTYFDVLYDLSGNLNSQTIFSNGADGEWFTNDDRPIFYYEYSAY